MPYTKLFYHIIWSTKNREPIITSAIEGKLDSYLAKKALSLGGIVYAINGISDHVYQVRREMNLPATLNALRA